MKNCERKISIFLN